MIYSPNMQRPYREHHLLASLEMFEREKKPLDASLGDYFREHKSLGSKDRAFIAETIYTLMRWKSLLDAFSPTPGSWEKRLNILQNRPVEELREEAHLPIETRLSCPSWLFEKLEAQYGRTHAEDICVVNNAQAPATIRINPLKASREQVFESLAQSLEVSYTSKAPFGITFKKRLNYFTLPIFKEGWFEVQDEGSQLLAGLVNPKPGELVLDYCAGSGGKSLAFAHKLERKGQIYLHDVRPHILIEARKRLKRAGIENAQIISSNEPHLKKLKKKMDWVFVDAPCSGTGTFRRNPDMKWRLQPADLERLIGLQRTIFEQALSFMKPGGFIVYGTCSILKEENEEQLAHFIKTYDLEMASEPLAILPTSDGPDGFYGAALRRQKK